MMYYDYDSQWYSEMINDIEDTKRNISKKKKKVTFSRFNNPFQNWRATSTTSISDEHHTITNSSPANSSPANSSPTNSSPANSSSIGSLTSVILPEISKSLVPTKSLVAVSSKARRLFLIGNSPIDLLSEDKLDGLDACCKDSKSNWGVLCNPNNSRLISRKKKAQQAKQLAGLHSVLYKYPKKSDTCICTITENFLLPIENLNFYNIDKIECQYAIDVDISSINIYKMLFEQLYKSGYFKPLKYKINKKLIKPKSKDLEVYGIGIIYHFIILNKRNYKIGFYVGMYFYDKFRSMVSVSRIYMMIKFIRYMSLTKNIVYKIGFIYGYIFAKDGGKKYETALPHIPDILIINSLAPVDYIVSNFYDHYFEFGRYLASIFLLNFGENITKMVMVEWMANLFDIDEEVRVPIIDAFLYTFNISQYENIEYIDDREYMKYMVKNYHPY